MKKVLLSIVIVLHINSWYDTDGCNQISRHFRPLKVKFKQL